MKNYFYDLHIHSCLSPCGDDDSTPDSIVGMGELNGLDIMALSDHNTCKNCPAFFEAAHRHGILPIAAMELTTAEDIHALCIFPNLASAMAFDEEISKRRMLIPNRVDIFGNQLICDSEDNIIGTEEHLLSVATDIGLEQAPALAEAFGGVCMPAHIDRASNGVIAVLGAFPKIPHFDFAEVHNGILLSEMSLLSKIPERKLLINSDAHFLWDIKEKNEYVSLEEIPEGSDSAGEYLIRFLRDGI